MSATAEALASLKVTIPAYFREATDHTIRRRLLLKLLDIQGNVVRNVQTPKFFWDIEVREAKVRALGGSDRHVWDENDVHEQLWLDHAELEATDVMRRRFQMLNTGSPQAIVQEAGKKMDRLVKSMTRRLNAQFYIDNSGTQSNMLTGVGSFLKYQTPNPADWILIPQVGTSYGGMSIELGVLGGNWSSDLPTPPSSVLGNDWPDGQGSPEYDYNAPKMMNVNGPIGGSTGWANNALKAIRRMTQRIKSTGGEGETPVLQLMDNEMYSQVEDLLEQRERLRISDYAAKLGFPDTLTYGGSLLSTDFDCPAGQGYAINPEHTILYTVHSDLFFTDTDWSTESQLSQFLVGFLGNYAHTPKYTGAYIQA